ncbi:MAG: pilus assembly protein PilM [Candidatus Omnitrophota bacterium]
MKELKIPFLNFGAPKSKSALDIGTSSVKSIVISRQKTGRMQVEHFSVEQFEGERSKESVVAALKRSVAKSETRIQRAVISVSGQSVVVRQVLFPKMSPDELRSALQFEAEKYIPFGINEVYIDAQIISDKAEGGKIKVLIVAAKKELVDEYLGYMNDAGIAPDAVDCDSIAVTNSFIFNNTGVGKDKTIALINVGASMTNVCILKNEMLNFARDIPVDIKSIDAIETQVRLSFDYYENQFGKGIDGIYISGGGAREPSIIERLKQAFGLDIIVWDPVSNLVLSPKVDAQALKEVSGQMAVCVGLAIRR